MRRLVLFFCLTFALNLFADDQSPIERPFARWSEAYKSTATVTVDNKKEELTFYLLIEATDNLPFIFQKRGKASTTGYTFYLTVERTEFYTKREVLMSAAFSENVLKIKNGVKIYNFLYQGERVEIKISPEEKTLKVNKLSVNSEDEIVVSSTSAPVYSGLDLQLEKTTLKECLKQD